FDVNFFGLVAGTLAVLPGMLDRRSGVVVNVASDSARAPEPGQGAYAATKAAIAAFSESVAHEVADRGVHVHVLYPAWVPTAMGERRARRRRPRRRHHRRRPGHRPWHGPAPGAQRRVDRGRRVEAAPR